MTREQFDQIVARLEPFAASRPRAYKLRVGLLGLLGYVYIFGVLAALLVSFGLAALAFLRTPGLSWLIGKWGWAVAVLLFVVGRALWVRLPAPEGLLLRSSQAPALFGAVEGVRRALGGPPVHRVLLTDELNAAVVQIPRLGIFGWHRNYLLLGLPLMQALSPDQFRAVLAHEFGHLSGAHSRLGGWIYRIRGTWDRLMEALARREHWAALLFGPFFRWYAPFFSAYSFVLARAQEYEADRRAADLVGASQVAEALIRSRVQGSFLARGFWPAVYRRANDAPAVPAPYAELGAALRAGAAPEQARRWLDRALVAPTDSADTHPSLADRLSALGQAVHLPAPVAETAADRFLGSALDDVTRTLDAGWQAREGASWGERYRYSQEAQARLGELDARAQRQPLAPEDAWQRAYWTEEFRGSDAALPLYQGILDDMSEHAPAHFAVGRLLLEREDEAGLGHLERAMALDPEAVLPACEQAYGFLMGQGQLQEARPYYERAVRQAELLERANAERSQVSPRDTFGEHGLPADALASLRSQLARYPQVARAYLVRKRVAHFPERPCYVLGVVLRTNWLQRLRHRHDDTPQQLARDMEFPGECLVLALDGRSGKLRKVLPAVPGSAIYP